MNKKNSRKCVIKLKFKSRDENIYFYGRRNEIYGNNLCKAIFDYEKVPEALKNSPDEEIIFLDSEKGLELLINEIEIREKEIFSEEKKLENKKKELEVLYNSNPKMINAYAKMYNKLALSVRKLCDSEEKRNIINKIITLKGS